MSRTRNATPRFYFSLRSPYSWLAYRELTQRHPDLVPRLQWRPFYEPDEASAAQLAAAGGRFVYTDMSREKSRYILQDVGRLAKDRGLTVSWPVDRRPVWEVPHLAWIVADRQGQGHRFIDAAYRARFGRGRDICDPATVEDIGRELGLDPRPLAGAADDPELRAEGVRHLVHCGEDGVFGVPFLVHGFTRFWGLDRLDAFVAHLRASAEPAASLPEPPAAVGAGRTTDGGHAGGCG